MESTNIGLPTFLRRYPTGTLREAASRLRQFTPVASSRTLPVHRTGSPHRKIRELIYYVSTAKPGTTVAVNWHSCLFFVPKILSDRQFCRAFIPSYCVDRHRAGVH